MSSVKTIFWNVEETRVRAGWRLIIQFALFLAFLVIVVMLDHLFFDSLPRSQIGGTDSILLPLEMLAAMLLSVWVSGRFLDRRRFADFGFRLNSSWWMDALFGFLLAAAFITLIFLIHISCGWATISEKFHTSVEGRPFLVDILISFLTITFMAALEEVCSRGYQLKNLIEGLRTKALHPRVSILISMFFISALFGALHYDAEVGIIGVISLTLGGLFYTSAYVLTGQLAIPLGFHIAWNFFEGNIFGFPVSNTDMGPAFIAVKENGPNLWTGGIFGPEAGLLGIGCHLVGILFVIIWVRLRQGRVCLPEKLTRPDLLIRKREIDQKQVAG